MFMPMRIWMCAAPKKDFQIIDFYYHISSLIISYFKQAVITKFIYTVLINGTRTFVCFLIFSLQNKFHMIKLNTINNVHQLILLKPVPGGD